MRIHSWHVTVPVGLLLLLPLLAFAQEPHAPKEQTKQDSPKPRIDLYGDPLPEGAVARLGTVRFRHQGPVLSIAYAPDGRIIVSASRDGTIRLWASATGKELRRFEADGQFNAVAFSLDGKRVAAGGGDPSLGADTGGKCECGMWILARSFGDFLHWSPIYSLLHSPRTVGPLPLQLVG